MKSLLLSLVAALLLTVSVSAAKSTINPISPQTKSVVKNETKGFANQTISYSVNETKEWCWVDWTVTITWSDGTTSSYSGTTGSASGCGAAINSAMGTIGQILEAVL